MQPSADPSGPLDSLVLSRRSLLKLGAAGSVVLGTTSFVAGLAGCGKREQALAQGFSFLRDADVAMFRALMPVVLGDALPQDPAQRDPLLAETLLRIDGGLALLAPTPQRELIKLFDLLQLRATRWLTTGIAAPWDEADPADIEAFLVRWRESSISAFNAGYGVLTRVVMGSFYAIRATWQQAGYPGPLAAVYQLVNT